MTPDEVHGCRRSGRAAGCKEAFFSLATGPKLSSPKCATTLATVRPSHDAFLPGRDVRARLKETGLLPHANPGLMGGAICRAARAVQSEHGLDARESVSDRLTGPGMPHDNAPDKAPRFG